jgi:hypothetical protein
MEERGLFVFLEIKKNSKKNIFNTLNNYLASKIFYPLVLQGVKNTFKSFCTKKDLRLMFLIIFYR